MRGAVTDCATATDFEPAKAEKGCGADGYVGRDLADDHDRGGVSGDEFGRHGGRRRGGYWAGERLGLCAAIGFGDKANVQACF